jgi:hypothetical protein
MTDDDLAEPLYDVSATWLLKERIEAQDALIAELLEALEGAFFWAEDAGSPHADRISEIAKAALAKAKAVQP